METIAAGSATPVGVVVKSGDCDAQTASIWQKRWRDRNLALWRAFDRFCVRPFSKAVRSVDFSSNLDGIPACSDTPLKVGKFAEELEPETIDFIRQLKPDFILRLGYGILKGAVLEVAPYGLWSFHHGDPAEFRGQPPGFWEMMRGKNVAGAILQVLNNELDAGRILHQGSFQVTLQSYAKTRDALYFGGSSFLRRVCTDIQLNGWNPVFVEEHQPPKGLVYRQPTNLTMLRFFWTILKARLSVIFEYKLHRQSWNCAVIQEPIHIVAGLAGPDRQRSALESAKWMRPPRGEFYADPFGIQLEGQRCRLFFERFDWKEGKGDIANAVFDGTEFSSTEDSLSATSHLSYPYLIKHKDGYHFIPEHCAARDVSSFSFDAQGKAISKKTMFKRCEFLDTTFLEWQGKVWAFAVIDGEVKNTDLYLFYASSFDGPWLAHPLNPIKSDVRSARPAGTPFVHNGKVFRPSQDCGSHYGSAVTVNQIKVMNETEYYEVEASRVEPNIGSSYGYGLHTLSQVGDTTLIDGAKRQIVFAG